MASANPPWTGACPRCGQADPGPVACPRCGVVFAKLRARPVAAATPAAVGREAAGDVFDDDEAPPRFRWSTALVAVVVVACAWVGWRNLRPAAKPASPGRAAAMPIPDARPESRPAAEPPPPVLTAVPPPAGEQVRVEANGMADEDRRLAESLAHRLPAVGAADVTTAQQLFDRHPEARNLLEATLLGAADGERRQRRYAEAVAYLERAVQIQADSARPCIALMATRIEAADWPGAEAAARTALVRDARNVDAWEGLGYALFRQDRNREAAEALRSALEIRSDPDTQAMLDRVTKGLTDEKGMTEQHLSHFHVRYDGEAHDDVGREILRALERHFATLASSLDHQPEATIPVILFSRETYYNAADAPAWSGGVYDSLDGRIRVPIQGLTRSLTPDMDSTLLHELTHAFVADRTRGVAPRDIQEGLAQYMEGERVTTRLTPEQLTMFADGRAGGVMGFYMYALSFVEYLVSTRGMGGMNDLLRAMGETGNVDEAFRRVHGQDYRATKQAWFQRLHQQHGS